MKSSLSKCDFNENRNYELLWKIKRSVGVKLCFQISSSFKPYIKGNAITGSAGSISNYERPERDQFTELPGSDKEEGGVTWRAYAANNGGEIDGAPAEIFPEEFQGIL